MDDNQFLGSPQQFIDTRDSALPSHGIPAKIGTTTQSLAMRSSRLNTE